MRILYFTQWYLPEPSHLQAETVSGMRDAGHEVTVLTGFPNYPTGKIYDGYRVRLWQKEVIDGVPVIRMPLYPDHSGSALRRVLNHVSLSLSTTCLAPLVVPKFDVLYGARPITLGLPAWFLSRCRRKPFVLEIADMWPETLQTTGMLNDRRLLGLIRRFSNWVCHRAAAVRVDTPGFRENLIDKGIPGEKIHFMPDWVDTTVYRPKPRDEGWARELGLTGRFIVMHAGNIGRSQGLESVLDVAAQLLDKPDIQFVFSGGVGVERDRLQQLAHERHLTNVKFLGRFPLEKMADVYALADVLLLQLRNLPYTHITIPLSETWADGTYVRGMPLARITIPHKIYAYLASGRPIIAAISGNTAEIVRGADAGIVCQPYDPSSMLDAVQRLYEMSPAERERIGRNGRRAACELYDVKPAVRRIVELLETITRQEGSTTRQGPKASHVLPLKELSKR